MELSKDTIVMLNALSAMGNTVEIIDTDGYYIYCSDNSNFADMPPADMIGKNMKDIYGLTDESSKVMQVIRTGVPLRDYVMSFRSVATGKQHLWLYSAYPLVVDGELKGGITVYRPFSNVKELVVEYNGTEKRKANAPATVQTKNLFQFKDIIYASSSMHDAVALGKKVSKSNVSVLLVGETGTGKELFAESIHSASNLMGRPFVAVNCAAIPDTLLESILFGVARGAYTGAVEKKGLFEQSSDGTIFLDEIQSLSPEMQAKLLRVLEYKVVRRVGGDKEIQVNPRIITAMNVNPQTYIKMGKMKPDLFYRIAVVTIHIPPLRERPLDVPVLMNHFIQKSLGADSGYSLRGSDEVMTRFHEYDWPGNARELEHVIQHVVAVKSSQDGYINLEDLPVDLRNHPEKQDKMEQMTQSLAPIAYGDSKDYKLAHGYALGAFNKQFHRFFIKRALEDSGYNVTKAAREMSITRQHLHKLMKQFDIQ